jgi:hypothetical protein
LLDLSACQEKTRRYRMDGLVLSVERDEGKQPYELRRVGYAIVGAVVAGY